MKKTYETPAIECIDVAIEQGIAATDNSVFGRSGQQFTSDDETVL